MGVGLGGRGIGDHRDLDNKGVRKEVAGENNGICIRETNLQTFYRHKVYGVLQYKRER